MNSSNYTGDLYCTVWILDCGGGGGGLHGKIINTFQCLNWSHIYNKKKQP